MKGDLLRFTELPTFSLSSQETTFKSGANSKLQSEHLPN